MMKMTVQIDEAVDRASTTTELSDNGIVTSTSTTRFSFGAIDYPQFIVDTICYAFCFLDRLLCLLVSFSNDLLLVVQNFLGSGDYFRQVQPNEI